MQITPSRISVSTHKLPLPNMSKRLYFNPSSDFSLSSPAVQHNTVRVCLQRLVWFPFSAEAGVFVLTCARFKRGQNGKIKSTRRIRGSQREVVGGHGRLFMPFVSTHLLKPSKTLDSDILPGGSQTDWRHFYVKKHLCILIYIFFYFSGRSMWQPGSTHLFPPCWTGDHRGAQRESTDSHKNKHTREVESRELGASAALMCWTDRGGWGRWAHNDRFLADDYRRLQRDILWLDCSINT